MAYIVSLQAVQPFSYLAYGFGSSLSSRLISWRKVSEMVKRGFSPSQVSQLDIIQSNSQSGVPATSIHFNARSLVPAPSLSAVPSN
uniref:Uncharacterized protein n=1 Tax=Ditylenchus dipsaci TaxID=166011 RepID=A0A915DQC1_9BILA